MKKTAIFITALVVSVLAGIAAVAYNYPIQMFVIVCLPALGLFVYRIYDYVYEMLKEIKEEENSKSF